MNQGVSNRPHFSLVEAGRFARRLYGMEASVEELPSTIDQIFALCPSSGARFVLKIANPGTPLESLECDNAALKYVDGHDDQIVCPRVLQSQDGAFIAEVTGGEGTRYFVRLFSWVPGVPLATAAPQTTALLNSLGSVLGRLSARLEGFSHPATIRKTPWDLARAREVMQEHRSLITDPSRQKRLATFAMHYDDIVAGRLSQLRRSVLHNDANDYNVLVESPGLARRVTGLIDFDTLYSHTVNELAVCLAYVMLDKDDPIAAASLVLKSYQQAFALTELEVELLYPLSCMRLCISVLMSAHHRQFVPEDPYLSISEQPAWRTLARLENVSPQQAYRAFRAVL